MVHTQSHLGELRQRRSQMYYVHTQSQLNEKRQWRPQMSHVSADWTMAMKVRRDGTYSQLSELRQ